MVFCVLWALADATVQAEVNDDDAIKHVVAEVQSVLEKEETQHAKSRIDFNSIPGHSRFINSERYSIMNFI